MLDSIFQTGMVFLFSALFIRKCSEDDPAEWYKLAVVSVGFIGFAAMAVSGLIMIWV
jgi:hypothetical protein